MLSKLLGFGYIFFQLMTLQRRRKLELEIPAKLRCSLRIEVPFLIQGDFLLGIWEVLVSFLQEVIPTSDAGMYKLIEDDMFL